jgi:hypothetical protein
VAGGRGGAGASKLVRDAIRDSPQLANLYSDFQKYSVQVQTHEPELRRVTTDLLKVEATVKSLPVLTRLADTILKLSTLLPKWVMSSSIAEFATKVAAVLPECRHIEEETERVPKFKEVLELVVKAIALCPADERWGPHQLDFNKLLAAADTEGRMRTVCRPR